MITELSGEKPEMECPHPFAKGDITGPISFLLLSLSRELILRHSVTFKSKDEHEKND